MSKIGTYVTSDDRNSDRRRDLSQTLSLPHKEEYVSIIDKAGRNPGTCFYLQESFIR